MMATLKLAKHARLRHDRVRDSQTLLLPERVIALSASAAEILALCDGRSETELLSELKTRYPEANLEKDVLEFLATARQKGWLE